MSAPHGERFSSVILDSEADMRDFRRLEVWRWSHALTLDVYGHTRRFPRQEQYGLVAQLRRAMISIPSNLAEGCGHRSEREIARFFQMARASASEVEYQLLLARDLEYFDEPTWRELAERLNSIKRMLAALLRKVRDGAGGNAGPHRR